MGLSAIVGAALVAALAKSPFPPAAHPELVEGRGKARMGVRPCQGLLPLPLPRSLSKDG